MRRTIPLVALLATACRGDGPVEAPPPQPPIAKPIDAGVLADADLSKAWWAPLRDMPHVIPERVVHIPVQPSVPRFDVAGPIIADTVAIVGSSQFGFAAIDWRTGTTAWTKPSGSRIAPPVIVAKETIALVGECTAPIDVPRDHDLLGCLRVVNFAGTERAYIAIHGAARDFAAAAGPQQMWRVDDRVIRWRRGDVAVTIDTVTGLAKPVDPAPPPILITYKDKSWSIERTEEKIIARDPKGATAWETKHPYSVLVGGVYLPDQSPMVRVLRIGPFGGIAEVNVLDIDATGSLHGQAAFPVPGIQLLGHAIDSIGDTALAVRLDKSIQHDFIAGYAANSLLMWVYHLPETPRADPVGIAIAPEAVVVFHDGDTLTILPELSAPPTAPGAARAGSSGSATP